MDLQRLQTFRTVATLMNFNQAAGLLNSSQSTVSARIKTLEDEIGIMLFKRIGKSIHLTEAGAKMVVYADKLPAISDEALAEVTGRKKHRLRSADHPDAADPGNLLSASCPP